MSLAEPAGTSQAKADRVLEPDWSALIAEAAQEVFEVMLGGKLIAACLCRDPQGGVTAMLGFAGSPCGVFSVRCSWSTASAIAGQMLGTAPDQLPPEQVCDALGEVCNMVAGSLKIRLSDAGSGCMMSIPTVVRGPEYEVRCLACDRCFGVGMEFDGQPVVFHLELQS